MKSRQRAHARKAAFTAETDLDITPFMNLMIVLVPVLLLSMVFTHMRVLHIQLPELTQRLEQPNQQDLIKQLELVITDTDMALYYPSGDLLKRFASQEDNALPTKELNTYLQTVKATFQAQGIEKSDIVLLPTPNLSYQQLIDVMDAVRSYSAVVANSVVPAELFPNIAFGEAPKS